MLIDGFEDGDIDEYTGDTGPYASTQTNPLVGDFSLEITTTSPGGRRIFRNDVSWGPAADSTLQCWINREHSASLLFGVQPNGDGFYYAQLRDVDTVDTEIVIARNEAGFNFLAQTALGIDRAQHDWLRVVVDWESDGTILVSVYDIESNHLADVSATDTIFGAGGVGVNMYASDSVEATSCIDQIETTTDHGDVTSRTALSGRFDIRDALAGDFVIRTQLTGNTQMRENQDAEITQGDTQLFDVSVVDGSGAAVDLTGASIEYRLGKRDPELTKTVGDGITVTNEVGGEFEVELTPTETAELVRSYRHAVEVTDGDGDVATVLSGTVFVRPDEP